MKRATARSRTADDDWYPTVDLTISGAGKSANLQADLDTGALGLYLSLEWALEHGIVSEQDISGLRRANMYNERRAHLGIATAVYYLPLQVVLAGKGQESKPETVVCEVVEHWSTSGFTKIHPRRLALMGRDLLRQLGATLEIDAQKLTTQVVPEDWRSFEREVADLYRALGLTVERDVNVAGSQIDVLLRERTESGKTLTTVVECKFLWKPVGVHQVQELAVLLKFLRSTGSADHAVLVSSSGFSKQARQAAQAAGIEPLEIADLRAHVQQRRDRVPTSEPATQKPKSGGALPRPSAKVVAVVPAITKTTRPASRKAFVIMPFDTAARDLYILGIRETLVSHGYTCVRGDEFEFSGRVMDKILDTMKDSTIVVAEVTEHNPNVFYELGVAHGLSKTVVLLTRDVEHVPFDIRDLSHIVYKDIVDLKGKLARRLDSLVFPDPKHPPADG